MGIEGIKKALLVGRAGLKAIRGGEPLIDLCLLGLAVSEVGIGRHGSLKGACKPGGSPRWNP